MRTRQTPIGITLLEVIALLAIIALAAILLLPIRSHFRESAVITGCCSNLRQIAKAMYMYADTPANNGYFPTNGGNADSYNTGAPLLSMHLLYRRYIADVRVFSCPSKAIPIEKLQPIRGLTMEDTFPAGGKFLSPESCSYGYDPGHRPDCAAAVVADKPGPNGSNSTNHGKDAPGQNVLLGCGTVEWMTSPVRAAGTAGLQENIFKRDPALPRDYDSFIRQ